MRNWRAVLVTCLTLAVLALAVQSVLAAVGGRYVFAGLLIIMAGILDGFDGLFARRLGCSSRFGARLDTYVDCISFGAAPAVLTYAALARDSLFGSVAATLIAISGALRFARGCSYEDSPDAHTFRGLPIPVSGTWFGLFVVLAHSELLGPVRPLVQYGPLGVLMWLCGLTFVGLQVSNIRYEKPRGPAVAIALAVVLAVGQIVRHPALVFFLGMGACLLLYAAIDPLTRSATVQDGEEECEERLAPDP